MPAADAEVIPAVFTDRTIRICKKRLLSGEKMQGRLPVSIPNMDEKGHLLEGILYEEGFGL